MAAPDHLTRSIVDPTSHTADGSRPSMPAPPTQRYLLDAEIARGGMGVIYRATDTVLGREIAVKVLLEKYAPDSGAAARFAGEACITGQLQHPSIPPVHDVGTLADGRPFLAMKLIKGQTLDEQLKTRTDATAERGRFVAVFEQICQALAYAHSHHVIHRDLKPANVMVGLFGEVQVMDWGLAKVLGAHVTLRGDPQATSTATLVGSVRDTDGSFTQAGSILGTPAYMPPEQAIAAITEIDYRSDVFGLGAILAVILTGEPPFTADSAETTRIMSARGDVAECFARLDSCGADPDLVALCKRCLAAKPTDRPADADVVAKAVAGLRLAADERARRAELERVRVEGERATAEAQAAERRKRRRLGLGAAAVLALAVVGGLTAVVVVQRRANAELAAEQAKVETRNKELAAEQAKVETRNKELAAEQAKVQARFDMAAKAIATFHTGVSEDALLKNPQFKELRTKLLNQAAGFYADVEKLLEGQTDLRSRKTLADGYFQLAELTDKIGDRKQALELHRKALTVRRELAAAPEADVETRLDVARSLRAVGGLLYYTADPTGAMRAWEEQRDIAMSLEAESATDAVRAVLARSHNTIGALLMESGKTPEALQAFQKAAAIQQMVADANPAVAGYQSDLALSFINIGVVMSRTGKPEEALLEWRKALAINQKLADANPKVTDFQSALAGIHNNIGDLLSQTGKPEDVLQEYTKALVIRQKVADGNPAVAEFQSNLAASHSSIGYFLSQTGKPEEALQAHQKALDIRQKLADANPAVTRFQRTVAQSHNLIGRLLAGQKRFDESFTAIDAGLAIRQQLSKVEPKNTEFATDLAYSYAYRGWALIRAGKRYEAAADLREAVDLWGKVKAPNTETRFERSRALALLAGLGGDEKSGVTKDEARSFADQSMAALEAVVKTGWALPNELKEPDFDAVRGRADFQKLFANVEAKANSTAAVR